MVVKDPEFIYPLKDWAISGKWLDLYRDGQGRLYEHGGVDLVLANGGPTLGAQIIACADARVHKVHKVGDGWGDGSFGNCVVLDHLGTLYYTITAHMQAIYVFEGDTVLQGQAIGTVGMTGNTDGPHVHWACDANEGFSPNRQPDSSGVLRIRSTTLVDPAKYLKKEAPAPPAPTLGDVTNSLNNLNGVVIANQAATVERFDQVAAEFVAIDGRLDRIETILAGIASAINGGKK